MPATLVRTSAAVGSTARALYSLCAGSRGGEGLIRSARILHTSGVGPGVDSHEKGTEPPPQRRRAARLTAPLAPSLGPGGQVWGTLVLCHVETIG